MGNDPDKNGNPDGRKRQILSKGRYELSWRDTHCGRVYAAGHAAKRNEGEKRTGRNADGNVNAAAHLRNKAGTSLEMLKRKEDTVRRLVASIKVISADRIQFQSGIVMEQEIGNE